MRPVLIGVITLAVLGTACGSHVESGGLGASAGPSASPAGSPSASPVVVPSAFPDLALVIGTRTGDLYFEMKNGRPSGPKLHVCESAVRNLTSFGRQALFMCGSPSTLYLWDDATASVTAIGAAENYAAFDGLGGIVYMAIGADVPTAPISKTRLVWRDLRAGTTRILDEQFGVAFGIYLTGEGVAVWRPKNSLSFVRSDADTGTWLVRGGSLTKFSQHRLIDGGKGRDVLETEPDGSCCRSVIFKTTLERRLTPPTVNDERPVAMLEDGRIVAWRPEHGEFDGSVVIYKPDAVERADPGQFSSFGVMRSGDWLIGQEISGPPALTLHAYRITDGTFAATSGGDITSLAPLGPKKGN